MIRLDAVIARFPDLSAPVIIDWVARGWVHAEGTEPAEFVFAEVDISRLHLLRDLQVDLALDTEAVPVVLSLLDQVYSLRRTLGHVMQAVGEAPDDVKRRVVAVLTSRM